MKMEYEVQIEQGYETFVIKALEQLSGPNRGWKFNRYADGRQDIQWFDLAEGLEPEPLENVLELAAKLAADYELVRYQVQRSQAYPSTGDQLDAIYHYFVDQGITNGFTEMIDEIKTQFPKPTSE